MILAISFHLSNGGITPFFPSIAVTMKYQLLEMRQKKKKPWPSALHSSERNMETKHEIANKKERKKQASCAG